MKEKPNNSGQKKGRPFFGRKKHRHDAEPEPRIQFPTFPCGICGQTITEITTALAFGPSQDPAHFDCVLKNLQEKESLGPGEQLTYLGSGTFGVIKAVEGNGVVPFQIQRKIQVEAKENVPQWRKDMKNLVKK